MRAFTFLFFFSVRFRHALLPAHLILPSPLTVPDYYQSDKRKNGWNRRISSHRYQSLPRCIRSRTSLEDVLCQRTKSRSEVLPRIEKAKGGSGLTYFHVHGATKELLQGDLSLLTDHAND